MTRIIPGTLALQAADLSIPKNCATPIAARLWLASAQGIAAQVELGFLHTGPQKWNIDIETGSGRLTLSLGGSVLTIDDREVQTPPLTEYSGLYEHFADLVKSRQVDVDIAPLQLVADAFLCGRHLEVDPFVE